MTVKMCPVGIKTEVLLPLPRRWALFHHSVRTQRWSQTSWGSHRQTVMSCDCAL